MRRINSKYRTGVAKENYDKRTMSIILKKAYEIKFIFI
jgi:hypothetical protein